MAGIGANVVIPALPRFRNALAGFRNEFGDKVLRTGMRKLVLSTKKDMQGFERGKIGQSLRIKIRGKGREITAFVEPGPGTYPLPSGRGYVRIKNFSPRRVAHLIERGTVIRRTKAGANRGKVTARPFAAPAFDLNAAKAEDIFGVVLHKAMLKAVS